MVRADAVEGREGEQTQVSSGRVFLIDTRAQRTLLHSWIILVIAKKHLVQIGRIDGPTEYLSSILTAIEWSTVIEKD